MCAMCAAAISFARMRRLYYGATDAKQGAVDTGRGSSPSRPAIMRPEVYGGIAEAQARELLIRFFKERR
jgi:tRNA(adenine34) deaminase